MPKQNGNPKILAAGAAVQLLTGIPAAWGVFQKPVMAQYGFSRGQAMLSFAILVAGYGIGCAIGGFVQDQHGPRYAALWGTALPPCCRRAMRRCSFWCTASRRG